MEKYIKNFPAEKAVVLKDQITCRQGEVVSKTLAQNDAVSVTLFAFDAGEEISTHESTGDAFVTVLEGTGIFTVDGVEHTVSAEQSLLMPAKKPHSVRGDEAFKWMLVVVFPKRQ
uniref:cupin domain-containing protein n=1 Tax=Eubacterium sp. TaxID=142586 RepID=UPI003FEF731E